MSQAPRRQRPGPKTKIRADVHAAPTGIFEIAFHNSPAMQSVMREADGVLVEVNDAFLKKLGFVREQVIGKTAADLHFWAEPEKLIDFREEFRTKGRVEGREVRLRASNGKPFTVLLSSFPVQIGGVAHVLSAGVDITARKEAEAELQMAHARLRQSEERFGKAFHSSPAMMAITRLSDGRFATVNEAFLRAIGYPEHEVVGKTGKDLHLHATPDQRDIFLQGITEHGYVRDHELLIRSKDGRLLTLLASGERTEIDGQPHLLSVALDITARKEAEEKLLESERRLRESEARFGQVFQASPVLMTVARLEDGKFVEVNPAFMQHLGLKREEILGKDSRELGLWVNLDARADFFRRLQARSAVRNVECQIRTPRGTFHTMLISGEIIEINRIPHLLTFALDITDLKRVEQTLRESEARFSTAFHASPLIMSVAKPEDTRLLEVNEAFVRFVGWPREQIIGRTSKELGLWVHGEERDRFYKLLGRGRLVRDFEALMRVRQGSLRHLQISAELLEINGETHLLTFAVDITEQRRAEQVLQDAESRTRALYETISAAAMVHDESGFIQVNSAAVKLFGAERMEQIVGVHPGQVSPPTQPDGESSILQAQRHMSRAMADGWHRFEWVYRKLDGTDFPVEVTLTTLELGTRRVMQAVVLDLTDRKRAEAELQTALEKERELSQLKSDFVSLVSHEFRTPLEIIMSSADNLQRYQDRLGAEKREQLLSTIHKSVRRMAGMMEEVLVLGRFETDRMTFTPTAIDLGYFCQRVADEIESASGKRCPISLHLPNTVASAVGDESALRHIFTNLLSNAVKYSAPGQTVDLIVEHEDEDAICRIVDRGCGIPLADQKRLFQAFHRGSNVRQIPGTGLGLLIVQRCVELHGGSIEFDSVEGQGTTFTVKLPLFKSKAVVHSET